MIQHYACHYRSPLGDMTLASDGDALTGAWFDGQKYFGSTLHGSPVTADLPVFRLSRAWLDRYFSGELPDDLPPLRPVGSVFRLAVWDLLKDIPYGTTRTYGDLARELARRTGRNVSAQAVGGAVGPFAPGRYGLRRLRGCLADRPGRQSPHQSRQVCRRGSVISRPPDTRPLGNGRLLCR